MKARRKSAPDVGIDMTPMIDMVFLLLVFFMCAATMSKVNLTPEITLPVAPKAQVPEDLRNRGTVNILPVGSRLADGREVTAESPFLISGKLVDDRGLKQEVASVREGNPELRVYLRVDRHVDFALVRRGIKACAEAGVFDVVFGSYQSGAAP